MSPDCKSATANGVSGLILQIRELQNFEISYLLTYLVTTPSVPESQSFWLRLAY
jgi:hypothetical protein